MAERGLTQQGVGIGLVIGLALFGGCVYLGAQGTTGAAVAAEAQDETASGDRIGSVPPFEAPDDWGTNRSPHFTFRYPPEYTADLDFKTREIVVTRRSDKAELIRIRFFNSEDPMFRTVADDVPFYKEILGSAVKKK